jgi:hypothetical protein
MFVIIYFLAVILNSECTSNKLKYVYGDALDDPLALAPDGNPYPW